MLLACFLMGLLTRKNFSVIKKGPATGMAAQVVGPFRGAKSDTTLWRRYPCRLPPGKYLVGDKAYQSVWGVLSPIKVGAHGFTHTQMTHFNSVMGSGLCLRPVQGGLTPPRVG